MAQKLVQTTLKVPVTSPLNDMLDTAYQRAKNIIIEHQRKLEALAGALLEDETIEQPTFEALMV